MSGEFERCFKVKVPAPGPGSMSKRAVVELIAKLKKSEAAKSQCGMRLLKWYDGVREGLR